MDCCTVFLTECCTLLGLCLTSACQSWCNLKNYGARGRCGSNGAAGCCGCLDDSFNEDSFDKLQAKNAKQDSLEHRSTQPEPRSMSVPTKKSDAGDIGTSPQ